MPTTVFKKGDWNAICPVDGMKYHASEFRKRWDGQWVHKSNWEKRHEQDFLRGVADDPSVAWTRPEQTDVEQSRIGWIAVDSVPSGNFPGDL